MNSITDLIHSFGISDNYKGFHELAAALRLVIYDEDLLTSISTNLFVMVSRQFGVSVDSIEHNIRRIIRICWYNPENRKALLQMAPVEPESCPTVCEFLDMLYWIMKKREKETGIKWR